MFKGSIVALITPFQDGRLDEPALRRLRNSCCWRMLTGVWSARHEWRARVGGGAPHCRLGAVEARLLTLVVLEADDEALLALLVEREGARLDREHPVAREAQHVLEVGVPRDCGRVRLLVQERPLLELIHRDGRVLVDDGELVLGSTGEVA